MDALLLLNRTYNNRYFHIQGLFYRYFPETDERLSDTMYKRYENIYR